MAAAVLVWGLACADGPNSVGPSAARRASLSLVAAFDAPTPIPLPAALRPVRLVATATRTDGADAPLVYERSVSPGDTVTIEWTVPASEVGYTVEIRLHAAGGEAVFQGEAVAVSRAADAQAAPTRVELRWVGPGADVASFEIAPSDTIVRFGTGFTLRVVALGPGGAPARSVSSVLEWITLDPALVALVDSAAGGMRAGPVRGTARIVARLGLVGMADTARVVVSAPPATLSVESGSGQSGTAGSTLPAAVVLRLTGSDGLPLAGERILFDAEPDGSATPAMALTDAAGHASMVWKVGSRVGIQTLRATAAALPSISATVTADVRAAAVASVEVVPDSAEIAMGDTVRLRAIARDPFGNEVTGLAVTWARVDPGLIRVCLCLYSDIDATGLVTAGTFAAGMETFRATIAGVSGHARVWTRSSPQPVGARLIHRWTFSETGGSGTTLLDDIGGAHGIVAEAGLNPAWVGGGQLTTGGGDWNVSDFASFPSGLLSGLTSATIEVWAAQLSVRNWSRVFDVGSGPGNNLFLSWTVGTDPNVDRVEWKGRELQTRDGTLSPYGLGSEHQIVMTIHSGGGAGGATRVRVYRNGALRGEFDTQNVLAELQDVNFWLGRSLYASDQTAHAAYNELRVYDGALTAAEVATRHLAGPVRDLSLRFLTIRNDYGQNIILDPGGTVGPGQAVTLRRDVPVSVSVYNCGGGGGCAWDPYLLALDRAYRVIEEPAGSANLKIVEETSGNALGIGFGPEQFSLISAGTFQMGSFTIGEGPPHTVNITTPFYMQRTEVTQSQWRAVMGAFHSSWSGYCGQADTCPVQFVTWSEVQAFIQQLNAVTPGAPYRLPTEAEWEYAARAGATGAYGGTGVVDQMGWTIENSGGTSHHVAGKLANAWGLFDMHGNTWEWVSDWFSAGYYSVSPVNDPQGPPTGTQRVKRGGSWADLAVNAKSSFRVAADIGGNAPGAMGFRLVRRQ